MATYAVITNGIVENIVDADEQSAHVVLPLLLPGHDEFILVTDETDAPHIGGEFINGKFKPLSPFQSWVFNESEWRWVAPVNYPDANKPYTWDEESLTWIEVTDLEPIEDIGSSE